MCFNLNQFVMILCFVIGDSLSELTDYSSPLMTLGRCLIRAQTSFKSCKEKGHSPKSGGEQSSHWLMLLTCFPFFTRQDFTKFSSQLSLSWSAIFTVGRRLSQGRDLMCKLCQQRAAGADVVRGDFRAPIPRLEELFQYLEPIPWSSTHLSCFPVLAACWEGFLGCAGSRGTQLLLPCFLSYSFHCCP